MGTQNKEKERIKFEKSNFKLGGGQEQNKPLN